MIDPIRQGDIIWADLGEPRGSEAGYRRPVLVLQGDALNLSRIDTIICIPLTGSIRFAELPGNLLLEATETGLDRDSALVTTLIAAVDRSHFEDWCGTLSERGLRQVFDKLDLILGR